MIAKSRRTRLLAICVTALVISPSLSFAQGPQSVPAQGAGKENAFPNESAVSSSSNGKLRLLTPALLLSTPHLTMAASYWNCGRFSAQLVPN